MTRGRALRLPALAVAITLTLAAAVGSQERAGDREAIQALRDRDARAVETGDVETLLGVTTDDVVLMPPGADFVRGNVERAAGLEAAAAAARGAHGVEYRFEFEELEIAGDRAIEWGQVRYRFTSADGSEARGRFKVLRVLKRLETGEWRVHRAMWNAFGGSR